MPTLEPEPSGVNTPPAPIDFEVIYADPPWRYDNGTPGREIERHYPTMTHEDICGLDVPAAKNAVLFLWGVAPKLPEALEVMSAWGFAYRTSAVWDKELVGMGYWFRGQHEHLLVGVRGNWSPPPQPLRVSSVYRQARGRHSKKPDIVRQQIATWWPEARRLEMFCRYPSPGWHVWGNQVDSSVADLPFERFDPHADPAQGDLVRRCGMTASNDRTAEALRIIQRTADRQGNVTMLRLAENIAHDAALVRMAQADGWDNAAQEAEDCGLLNDVFADEMRGRNPYRGTTARDEAGGRCVVCSRSAPHHGGLCCFHKYDEQPTCDLCAVDEDPDCHHEWLDRPESDTRECLICGTEVAG